MTSNAQLAAPAPVVPDIATPSLASDPAVNFDGLGPGESRSSLESNGITIAIVPRPMKSQGSRVSLCVDVANLGEEHGAIDLRRFTALDEKGRWGEQLAPMGHSQLVLNTHSVAHQTLVFDFPEPPESVELRFANLEDRVLAAWDFDLVPRVRELRIYYKVRGYDPQLGVAIPVGAAPRAHGVEGAGLVVNLGDGVKLTVLNSTTTGRDFAVDGLGIQSLKIEPDSEWQVEFRADTPGRFTFYDSRDPRGSIKGIFAVYTAPDEADGCG